MGIEDYRHLGTDIAVDFEVEVLADGFSAVPISLIETEPISTAMST
ncbi:hypothetical protein HMPREF3150_01184 [Pseudomonas aeruginosa]|nr:hypothetical protein HMPREF3150_01184 [Pseudomonas aeruginosa]